MSLKSDESVREYLLGRVSDETRLEEIEQRLFSEAEFCSQVQLVEDDLINDYVMGRLNPADAESFRATLHHNSDRRRKCQLTAALKQKAEAGDVKQTATSPSFIDALRALFRQPQYVAVLAVLLIAVAGVAVYLSSKPSPGELAKLRAIYRDARPTETRISEFGYAPLVQLRGPAQPDEQRELRQIENNLLDTATDKPDADSHHALGIYYVTQHQYPEAIKEFEAALKLADQNARLHNDLGVAYFELSKTLPKEKRLEQLAQSLEEFIKATELDSSLLEALFNKSLTLQELNTPREAKESWKLYLQKDPSSPWAEEARKNLAQLESVQSSFKSKEQVLSDFLTAYHNGDAARARKIHDDTKGTLKDVTVPLQLTRRHLSAKQIGDEREARESLDALVYIGELDHKETGDAFFLALAKFYAGVGAEKVEGLLHAHAMLAAAHQLVATDAAQAVSQFEKSRDVFLRLGDECEAAVAEIWAAQVLPDIGKVAESRSRLNKIIANGEKSNFNVLLPPCYYWLGIGDYRQGHFSASAKNLKTALQLAQAANNFFEIQHTQHALAANYSELGELEPAWRYSVGLLETQDLYYQNPSQDWRNKGIVGELALKRNFFSTALVVARERLSIAKELWSTDTRVNDSFRLMIEAAKASENFRAALEYASESLQVASTNTATAENSRKVAEIYLLQADVRRLSKDCDGALSDYDKAFELYGRLPEVTETLYQLHKGKLFCFQQLKRQDDFSSELETVFELAEKYRSTIREDESRQAFFAGEQDVFDAATANMLAQQDARRAFAFVEGSRARSLLDFVESGKTIVEVERDFGPVAQPLSVAEIQARLPEQLQVVQYAILPEKLAIWTLSKTRFDFAEKQITAAELGKKVEAYQALIIDGSSPAKIKPEAQDLYQLLIPSDLAADKLLCLVPDKSLHRLAFATLVSPTGSYLLQSYALFYAPSSSVLVLATENARARAQRQANRPETLLSVGNPDFDRQENTNLPDLKDAEAEARTIGAEYSGSYEMVGAQATKEKFLRNIGEVEVIHFAGHFLANRLSPGNSKLLFADGELRASELRASRLLSAKLVVLSACETGVEDYNKSEGAIGIARTWLALGAPVVVASQWKVESESTKKLMIDFHLNRKQKGMTSAESLRQAQLALLSRDETKAPFYWAAFSLFGGYANY